MWIDTDKKNLQYLATEIHEVKNGLSRGLFPWQHIGLHTSFILNIHSYTYIFCRQKAVDVSDPQHYYFYVGNKKYFKMSELFRKRVCNLSVTTDFV